MGTDLTNEQRVLDDIKRLSPWFHNIHLSDGLQTFPHHHFGDFPHWKWQQLAPHLPVNLSGWSVLDIGCNAGSTALSSPGEARRSWGLTGILIFLLRHDGQPVIWD
jgi:hypothetical protein